MTQRTATRLWQSLEAGTWSVVEQLDRDGRQFLLVRENDPAVREAHASTRRERQVLEYASHGYSNKHIAYELGITASTVSTHLSSVAGKLGLHTRSAIIRTYAAMVGSANAAVSYVRWSGERFAMVSLPFGPSLPDTLSPAEREVVALVFAGKSNAGIARHRGVSLHTVANQIAAAMKKLKVGSRADMIAWLMRS